MWQMLEKISEQVTKYTTFLGQLWYVLVFVFRLFVVASIGGSVYGDEQSAFKCSEDVVGCTNICYNEFAKISHMRFWAFQLLAIATPTVFFHFYSIYISGEIQKIRTAENKLKSIEDGEAETSLYTNPEAERDFRKMSKRKKSVGNIKVRRYYSGDELKEIPYTNKIHYVYFLSVIARLVLEGVFIHLGYLLFKQMDPTCDYQGNGAFCEGNGNPFYFLWMKVPAFYRCTGVEGSDVWRACTMHVDKNKMGYVPCFISRPYEKTVFLCYMGVLSGLCFLISALELVVVVVRRLWKRKPKTHKLRDLNREFNRNNRPESVFYPTAPPNKYTYDDAQTYYPTNGLAVPIRINHRGFDQLEMEKHVQINDGDRDSEMKKKEKSASASVKSFD